MMPFFTPQFIATNVLSFTLKMMRGLTQFNGSVPTHPNIRTNFDDLIEKFPQPHGVGYWEVQVETLSALWCIPKGITEKAPVLLYFHGGGYALGSAYGYRHFVGELALQAQCRALLIDYRRAPEHPFPAAAEDALTSYQWLIQHESAAPVVIAGDSAGGGLALATLTAARDKGLPLPQGGLVLSPWTDLAISGRSVIDKASHDPVLTPAMVRTMAHQYLNGHDPRDSRASPLYGEMQGLPPLFIQVGSHEVLLDDATRYAEKAGRAGVNVELQIWPDMFHVFHLFSHMLPQSQQALKEAAQFIQRCVGNPEQNK